MGVDEMEKTTAELEIGDWFRTQHFPEAIPNHWRITINRRGGYSRYAKNCIARLTRKSRLFGHTWKITYICTCPRGFEERVKTGTRFEIVPEGEVMMRRLTS